MKSKQNTIEKGFVLVVVLGMVMLLTVLLLGFSTPKSPLFCNADYGEGYNLVEVLQGNGIADEKAYYFPGTSLLNARRDTLYPIGEFTEKGRRLKEDEVRFQIEGHTL